MIRNSSELRLELYQTTRQLTHTQVKCRALEEELHTPLNVHRWRKLEVNYIGTKICGPTWTFAY